MKFLLPLILLFFTTSHGQVKDLAELSSGKFLDSRIVYNDNQDDVYGYILLYENDRKSKAVYELEYVLLDKNLNRLTSGTFIQNRVSSFVKFVIEFSFVRKLENKLIIGLQDVATIMGETSVINFRYRELDLNTFELSPQFTMKNLEKTTGNEISDGKVSYSDLPKFLPLLPIGSTNFIVMDQDKYMGHYEGTEMEERYAKKIHRFVVYDKNLKPIWDYNFNNKDIKGYEIFKYYDSDGEDVILQRSRKKNFRTNPETNYEVFDLTSGKLKFSIKQIDKDYINSLQSIAFQKDYLTVYSTVNRIENSKVFDNAQIIGLSKVTYNRLNGEKSSQNIFLFRDLASKLEISEEGKIKSYGYLQFLNVRLAENGNTTAIAEGYSPSGNSSILDMFIFEFDSQMKLLYFKKVDKIKNLSNLPSWGERLKFYGAFDFLYSQKLEGDNYAYFYTDNEKRSTRSPKWILGVITQVDGQFNYEKIPMTTDNGQIYPVKAKNGYILLREETDRKSTLRLEKVNY